MSTEKRDVFLCHASEDKAEVVTPLVAALNDAGISYWYDQAEIKWGDSIPQKVNDGLKISRYVVVILSQAFLSKNWPQRELNSALSIEASSGEVRVLPLLVGPEPAKQQILETYPLLIQKHYIEWGENASAVVAALRDRLSARASADRLESQSEIDASLDIPMPTVERKFTQREKDLFLKTSFGVIKAYFREALGRLETLYSQVETDFTDVHRFKFICTIYLSGDIASKCKIWLSARYGSDAILYSSGQIDIESDNSSNAWLSVSKTGRQLGLETSGAPPYTPGVQKGQPVRAEEAAELLWRWFSADLNQKQGSL